MAVHTVAAGDRAAHAITLTPDVVEVVAFTRDPENIEVLSDGAAEVYFTVNGSDPTVGGAHCYVLPAALSVRELPHRQAHPVKLVSSGAATVSVSSVKVS